MKKHVGFIGLGLMGLPMSKNILKKGFDLTVYNRTPDKTKELVKLGAKTAATPAALAKLCDVIVVMITAAKDVEEVLFGPEGVVSGAKNPSTGSGLTIIDSGTIGPTAAKAIAKRLATKGLEYLDAPVTGSTPKAITGELTFFIGGKEDVYKKNKDVFAAMGTNLQYIGKSGSGQAIKMINNYLIAASITALAEGMLLADALDLPRKRAAEVLQTVPAMSPMMNLKLPNYVKDEFPLLFTMANMKKDITLALEEATGNKTDLPVLMHLQKLFEEAMTHYSEEDFSIIVKLLQKKV